MENRYIDTDAGKLELSPVTIGQLSGIAYFWPMELLHPSENSEAYGLVFQRGSLEVYGIRMQSFELPESKAFKCHFYQICSVVTALPIYLRNEHLGLIFPCPYTKKKANGNIECGIALFLSSAPDSMSKLDPDREAIADWESAFGEGASAMIYDMVDAIHSAACSLGKAENNQPISIDYRPIPRLSIGALTMHFAILGRQVLLIKSPLKENDPTLDWLIHNGINSLPYAPMIPVKVPEIVH